MAAKQLAPEQLKAISTAATAQYIAFDTSVLEEMAKAGADPKILAPVTSRMAKVVQKSEQVQVLYYDRDTTGGATGVIDPYGYSSLNSLSATTLKEKTLTWGGIGYTLSVPYIKRVTQNFIDTLETSIIEAVRSTWLDVEYLVFKGTGSSGQPTGLDAQITQTYSAGSAALTMAKVIEAYGTLFDALGGPNATLNGYLILPPKIYQNFLGTELTGLSSPQYVVTQGEERIVYKPKKILDLAYGQLEVIPSPHLAGTTNSNKAYIIIDPDPYFGPNMRLYTCPEENPVIFKPEEDLVRTPAQLVFFFQPYLVNPDAAIKIINIA